MHSIYRTVNMYCYVNILCYYKKIYIQSIQINKQYFKQHLYISVSHLDFRSQTVCSHTVTFAAEKGHRRFQGAVDSRLHHQLLCPNPMQGLYTTSMSSRVLQCHYDLLPVVEWHAEFPFFRHKRPLSSHRIDYLLTLPACHQVNPVNVSEHTQLLCWSLGNQGFV